MDQEERPGLGPAGQFVLSRDGCDVQVERDLVVAQGDEVAEELLLVDEPDRLVVTAVGPLEGSGAEAASGQRSGEDSGRRQPGDALRSAIDHIPILRPEASSTEGEGPRRPGHLVEFAPPVKTKRHRWRLDASRMA
jgi:hypothetical protein